MRRCVVAVAVVVFVFVLVAGIGLAEANIMGPSRMAGSGPVVEKYYGGKFDIIVGRVLNFEDLRRSGIVKTPFSYSCLADIESKLTYREDVFIQSVKVRTESRMYDGEICDILEKAAESGDDVIVALRHQKTFSGGRKTWNHFIGVHGITLDLFE
jgi:hypothetical protein